MKSYFFVLLSCFCIISHAQNTKLIDSLRQALKLRIQDDSIKVSLLTRLHEKLMFSKPEEAKSYAEQELVISEKINYERGLALGNMHLADYYGNRSENDSALYYYKKAKAYFKAINSSRGFIFVNHSLASLQKMKGEYDSAIATIEENLKAISSSEKEGKLKTKMIGAAYASLGNIYLEKGAYKIALSKYLKALSLFEDINHETRKADVLKQLGDVEHILKNYPSAINYYNTAIKIYKRYDDKIYMAFAYSALGETYEVMGDYDNAKQQQYLALSVARETQDKLALSNALCNLGRLMLYEKKYKKAREFLLEAKDEAEKENLKLSMVKVYNGLAKLEDSLGNFTQAIAKTNKALVVAKPLGMLPELEELYEYKSQLLEKTNNSKQAILNLKASYKVRDSIFSIKKAQQLEELKLIYDTEKKEVEIALQENEIKVLSAQSKSNRLLKIIYGIGMVLFLVLAGFLYVVFRQRMKKNKIERDKQEEIYKQELAFKRKELASQTLHLVQKSTFIKELKDSLEHVKNSPEQFKQEYRRLMLLIKKESSEDKNWEVFKSYFSEVHNNFEDKLKAVGQDLTEKEIRLAAFLRMNLSTKEIASTLNVLPESVLKSKYRLKKKLELGKEQDLKVFLDAI